MTFCSYGYSQANCNERTQNSPCPQTPTTTRTHIHIHRRARAHTYTHTGFLPVRVGRHLSMMNSHASAASWSWRCNPHLCAAKIFKEWLPAEWSSASKHHSSLRATDRRGESLAAASGHPACRRVRQEMERSLDTASRQAAWETAPS